MSFLRGLLWFLFAIVLVAVAMYATGNFALSEYLTGLFLTLQPYLPLELSFDQFLVVTAVASLMIVFLVVTACTAMLVWMGGRLSLTRQQQAGQAAASQRELAHLREERKRQFEQLLGLSQSLTKKLDKRVIVQSIVEAASRMTSVPQANSAVGLWLVAFGTDVMKFEIGRYCEEPWFTKPEYLLSEEPFATVIQKQESVLIPAWAHGLPLVKAEKAASLNATASAIAVPLVVEGTVLGVMIVFCHPDVLKSYQEQAAFYHALWGELSLALAVAIQGELAIIDRLTGVHNREYFMRRFIQEIDRASRYQFPLSVLMVDIDHFKAVNDALGHPQGDAVLRIISKLIKQEVRAIDLVGRYGGEEFIILLPETGLGEEGTTAAAGARVVAERIRKAVDDEFHGMQKPLALTISVGLVVRRFPQDRTMDHKELIRLADQELYRAKTTGRNQVCAYVPPPSEQ